MKKLYITLALAFIGFTGYGQTFKKVVITKSGKTDTLLQVVETKTTTQTIDTTTTQAVDITVQWGTASASNTISLTNLILEAKY